jgi:CheY-like chemotaxis protein
MTTISKMVSMPRFVPIGPGRQTLAPPPAKVVHSCLKPASGPVDNCIMAVTGTHTSGWQGGRTPRRILLIDDERVSRFTTQSVLEKLGFDVETLDDGRSAAEAEATGEYAAVIMDCQMPFVDGFEATAAIRRQQRQGRGRRTPIIGLSARSMAGDEEVALSKGMDVYLTKPVSARKLQAALDQVQVNTGAGSQG